MKTASSFDSVYKRRMVFLVVCDIMGNFEFGISRLLYTLELTGYISESVSPYKL